MFFRLTLGLGSIASLIVAAPSMLAAIWMAIGDPIVDDLRAGLQPQPDEVATLLETREAATSLVDWSASYSDLAFARLVADQTTGNADRVVTASRRSTELNAISPYVWQRHAGLLAYHEQYRTEGVEAWRSARALGKNVRHLLLDRIRIGTQLYREMLPEDRDALRSDILEAYDHNRGQLRAYGRQMNLIEWFKFLLRDPEKTEFLAA